MFVSLLVFLGFKIFYLFFVSIISPHKQYMIPIMVFIIVSLCRV